MWTNIIQNFDRQKEGKISINETHKLYDKIVWKAKQMKLSGFYRTPKPPHPL